MYILLEARRHVRIVAVLVAAFSFLVVAGLWSSNGHGQRAQAGPGDEVSPPTSLIDQVVAGTEAASPTTGAPDPTTPAPAATAAPTTTRSTRSASTAAPSGASGSSFLACTRHRESRGDYRAVSANGTYRGAYQFNQSTWDNAARHAGRASLVGRHPDQAAPGDQDAVAWSLYQWQGSSPWGGACG